MYDNRLSALGNKSFKFSYVCVYNIPVRCGDFLSERNSYGIFIFFVILYYGSMKCALRFVRILALILRMCTECFVH